MTIIDSCVIIDLIANDPNWITWSSGRLADAKQNGPVGAPDIVFAETAMSFSSAAECRQAWNQLGIQLRHLGDEALFRAGEAFLQYRTNQGQKRSPLPDFYIGAFAEIEGLPIITRDTGRFSTYFPKVRLITP